MLGFQTPGHIADTTELKVGTALNHKHVARDSLRISRKLWIVLITVFKAVTTRQNLTSEESV